jgi:LAO/AO transport system kinase
VSTVASRGRGVEELLAALDKHARWLERSGEGPRRRLARAAAEVEAIAVAALRSRIGDLHGSEALDTLAAEVVTGTLDPYAAADQLVDTLTT